MTSRSPSKRRLRSRAHSRTLTLNQTLTLTLTLTLQSTLEDARTEAREATAALAALDVERLALRGSTQRWFYTRGAIEWLHARRDERPSAGEEAADEASYELGGSGGGALDGAQGGAGGVLVGAGVERVARRGSSKDEPTAAHRLFEEQMDAVDETLRRSSELKQRRAGLLEARRAALAVCHVIEQSDELSKWDEIPVPNRPELCVQKGCCSSACKRSPRRPHPSPQVPNRPELCVDREWNFRMGSHSSAARAAKARASAAKSSAAAAAAAAAAAGDLDIDVLKKTIKDAKKLRLNTSDAEKTLARLEAEADALVKTGRVPNSGGVTSGGGDPKGGGVTKESGALTGAANEATRAVSSQPAEGGALTTALSQICFYCAGLNPPVIAANFL
jgi:hypothetical protein